MRTYDTRSVRRRSIARALATLLTVFGLLSVAPPAGAAVGVLDAWTDLNGPCSTCGNYTPSAGTNRLLVFVTGYEDGVGEIPALSVTFGGVPMTEAVTMVVDPGGASTRVSIFYLVDALIPAGPANFDVTNGPTPAPDGEAHSYALFSGVDQADPVPVGATGTGSTGAVDTVSTGVFNVLQDGMSVTIAACGNAGNYATGSWGGWTEVSDQNNGGNGWTMGAAYTSTVYGANGTDSATATYVSGANRQVIAAASLKPAPPAAADVTQIHYRWRNDDGPESGSLDTGDGTDGALVPVGSFDLNIDTSGARVFADGIAYRIDAGTATGNSVDRFSGADTLSNGIVAGDEVLLINLQGTAGDGADVGNYEFLEVQSVTASTITFTSSISNSYDGTVPANQLVVVQRVPNYTSVTVNGGDGVTASTWDSLTTTPAGSAGYYTGIVVFRATGTVNVNGGGRIEVDGDGYRGGAGGNLTGGSNGESYDGIVGSGGTDTVPGGGGGNPGTDGGGGSSNYDTGASPAGTRGGGGGGGHADAGAANDGAGGAGGGGYGGGGGGGGGGGDGGGIGGNGGLGGTTGVDAGGGGMSGDNEAGGNGGTAPNDGALTSTCPGPAALGGSGPTTGEGGATECAGAGSGGVGAGGAGGGGLYGAAALTRLFFGSGGGGGGGHDDTPLVGADGGNGGGIVFIIADTVVVAGSLSSDGDPGTAGGTIEGAGGGGSGGSVLIQANTANLGASLVLATGGAIGGVGAIAGGGGGEGGVGRIHIGADTITGTTSPGADTSGTPGGGGATWAAGEDTKLTDLAKSTIRRVRFAVSNEGGATSGAVTYQLQVAETATCSAGSYTAVPTDTSGHWQVADSTFITDPEATSNISPGLTDEASGFVAGELKDAGNTTGSITLNSDEFTEIEFAVQATANGTDGGDYCFRLASSVDSYDVYAEVSLVGVANAPPVITVGDTDVTPASLDVIGAGTTTFRVDWTDSDSAVGDFSVVFRAREPDNTTVVLIPGSATIFDDGGGAFHATLAWDPNDVTAVLGLYDLQAEVTDALSSTVTDGYANNLDELTLVDAGHIGHWTFDEGTGQTAGDTAGTNDGTLGTTPGVDANDPNWACVVDGNALHFDGTNDFIEIPDDPALEPSGDMTVAAWVKFDVLPITRAERAHFIYKEHNGSPFFSYYLSANDTGEAIFFWKNSADTNYWAESTNETFVTDTWYHFTGVKDGTTLRIYVNGTDANSTTDTTTGTLFDSDWPLNIGASSPGADRLDGLVDDVRLYDRALSPAEIAALAASSPIDCSKYRSVGITATDLNTNSRTVQISGSTATFSSSMPPNIGVGDVLQYQVTGTFYLAFIHGRTSDTVYTVRNSSGDTPQAAAAGTAVGVYRSYTSLFNWEVQDENDTLNGTVEDFDTSTDLVAADTIMNVAAYGDGPDTTAVAINGWATAPANYIRIFTPTSTSEVGTSQRHNGVWDTSAYHLEVGNDDAMAVEVNYVKIDGLQVFLTGTDANDESAIYFKNQTGAGEGTVSNSIVRGTTTVFQWNSGIVYLNVGTLTLNVYNNIIYGFDGPGAETGCVVTDDNSGTAYVYNNTVYGCYHGIFDWDSNMVVKNNIAFNNTNDYTAQALPFLAASDNNLGEDPAFPQDSNYVQTSQTAAQMFVDPAGSDFHILSSSDARDAGANLSGDPNLPFTDDIDQETRPTNWDIGADENGAAATMQVLSGFFVGDGIGPRSIYVGFRPDVVILKRDSGATTSVVRTSTMVGDVTKDGDVLGVAFFADGITSLDATGFTVGADFRVNFSGDNHYWVAFKAGAGEMKVGTYTGDGFDDRSVTGVDFQPDYVMTLPEGAFSPLHRTSTMPGDQSYDFDATQWGPPGNRIQALEADGFQVGDLAFVNAGGGTYHYIAWKAVAGRMALGTYTGDDFDGRAIDDAGFPPEWVLVKAENSIRPWIHKPASTGVSTDYALNLSDAGGFPGSSNFIQAIRPLGFEVGDWVAVNEGGTLYHWIAFAGENLSQIHYRWRNDDGNEATATWADAEDTKLTGLAKSDTRRVRFEVSNEGAASSVPVTYQLQVAETATCSLGSYTAVPTDTSGHWQVIGSANITDGEATSNVPGGLFDEASTFVGGEAKDAGNTTGSITLDADEFTEIEFAVQATTNATDLGDYCFRLVDSSSGNPLDSYSAYAEVSLAAGGPPTLTLADHDAGQVVDQFATTTPVTSELFGFKLANTGTVTVDNIRVHFTTSGGVASGDVTNGELYRDNNDDGVIDGGDTQLATGITPAGGVLAFTSLSEDPGIGTNYLVRATVANLAPGDTTTFSLSIADIDELQGGVTESGAASNAVHTVDSASGGDVYYSVGTSRATSTDLKTGTPNITITNGTATLTEPQTGNVGVGDEIDYGAASPVYIKQVLSQTQFVVHAPDGSVPANAGSTTVNSIMRAFAEMGNPARLPGVGAIANSSDASHLNNTNLTAGGANATLTWVLYNDGLFTELDVNIAGYTVDATHFLTLTVAGADQVASGVSQRHDGTAYTGARYQSANPPGSWAMQVQESYTRVHWLEIDCNTPAGWCSTGITFDRPFGEAANLMIYDSRWSAIWMESNVSELVVRNSILYNNGSGGAGQRADIQVWSPQNPGSTLYVYNTTIYNSGRRGIGCLTACDPDVTIVAKNNVVLGTTTEAFDSAVPNWADSGYNMEDDGTAPGSNNVSGVAVNEFVDITPGFEDLHLQPTSAAINVGTNTLSGIFNNDIDDETRGSLWDMGADEQGPGGDVYYSVGTDNTDLKTGSPAISILGGTATVSVAQTGNVGVGDEIDYDTDNKIAYIKSVISQTQFIVHTATGAVPGNVTSVTVNSIMRAFNDFATAEANSGDASHLNNFDLTGAGAGAKLTWVAYNDGPFNVSATTSISSYTTDASHYITLTVAGASQVASGVSQRHTGVAGTGAAMELNAGGITGLFVDEPFTRVEWLEIDGNDNSTTDGIQVDDNADNSLAQKLVIHNTGGDGIFVSSGNDSTEIRNIIVYAYDGDGVHASGSNTKIYNSTFHLGRTTPASNSVQTDTLATNVLLENVLAIGPETDFWENTGGTLTLNNCMSSDATADDFLGTGNIVGVDPNTQFVSTTGTIDLHLADTSDAIDAGLNRSSLFTDDIDGQARNGLWDIGADEAGCAFGCSMQITIDHTQVGLDNNPGSLSNFPVLIDITDTDLELAPTGKVEHALGYDIVFRAADGVTPLDHEIEDYDSGAGRIRAWVRIPSLAKDVDTVIYMRFGSACVSSSQENAAGVWDDNYLGVWHLKETPSATVADSTGVHNGTPTNMEAGDQEDGQIDGSLHFNEGSSNENVDLPDHADWTLSSGIDRTFEGWFNLDSLPSSGEFPTILYADSDAWSFDLVNLGSGTALNWWDGTTDYDVNISVNAGDWHHFFLVLDFGQTNGGIWYLDGVPQGTFTPPNVNVNPTGVAIGGAPGDDYFFGLLDEVRMSDNLRSPEWIRTQYNNQNVPANFYTVAAASSTFTLADHGAGQVTDKFATATPVTDALFGFNLSRSGGATVDTLRVNFTTSVGVVDGDVSNGELYRDENGDGAVDGGDTPIQGGVTPSGGTLTFTTNFSPDVAGTNYLVQATVANLVGGDTTTFSLAPEDIDTVELNVCSSGSTTNAVHTQDPAGSLVLADHDSGQIPDQFGTSTPVTSELFAFKLTRSLAVTVDNIRVHFSTTGGVVSGDVTSGELWRDLNNNGVIDVGPDTSVMTGVSASGGFLNFAGIGEDPGSSGTNYLVRATVANLVAGDVTTFSLGVLDIDEVESGVSESGTTSFAIHTADSASGGDVYYSVGTSRATSTDLKTGSPTITIVNGTATLNQTQTGDIGVGDEIDYDTDNKIAYIKSVLSPTQFILHDAIGGLPGNVSGVAVNSIMRAFDTMTNAEANSADASHLNNLDLTATGADANLTWVAYKDGALDLVQILGYTTDATHTITLTVASASQVASGTSQRHDGTAGTGVVIDIGGSSLDGVNVRDDFVTVEWLEIKNGTGIANGILATNQAVSNRIFIRNNLVHDVSNLGIATNDEDLIIDIYNNIVYTTGNAGIRIDVTPVTAASEFRILNNTVYDTGDSGIRTTSGVGSAEITLQNNISHTTVGDAFSCGSPVVINAASSNNLAWDGTGTTHSTTGGQDTVSLAEVAFVDEPGRDLHIRGGSFAQNAGANLSGIFGNDIDDETRGAAFDIGADETLVTANYRSIGTATDYATNTVTATNGSVVVTGDTTLWLTNNRGRGDRINIDGVDYTVLSVDSETQLRLTAPYAGVGGSGLTYDISRKFQTLQAWEDCISNAGGASSVAALDAWANTDTTCRRPCDGAGDCPFTPSAGSDRLLVFVWGFESSDADQPVSVTFGGQAMTQAVTHNWFSAPWTERVQIFYLKEADFPGGGPWDFLVSGYNVNDEAGAAWAVFSGVDQNNSIVAGGTAFADDEFTAQVGPTPPFNVLQGGMAIANSLVTSGSAGHDYTNNTPAWTVGPNLTPCSALGLQAGNTTAAYGASGTDTLRVDTAFTEVQVIAVASLAPAGSSTCEGVSSPDFVADGRKEIGVAYDDSVVAADPDFTVGVDINGSTTDADHDITLTADGDNRHYGLEGQGVALDNGVAATDAVSVQDDFVTVEWLEIFGGSGGDAIDTSNQNSSNFLVLRNLLVHDIAGASAIQTHHAETNADIYNNFLYDASSHGVITQALTTGSIRVMNNTTYSNGWGIRALGASTPNVLIQNNIAHSNPNDDFQANGPNGANSNNLSSDTTATTIGPIGDLPSVSLAAVGFVDDAGPGIDLHLTDTSAAILAGTDLSSIFTRDIDEGDRVAFWDVGADEFEATTAVDLVWFEAYGVDGAVELRWETGSELDNLGFHLYRSLTEEGLYEPITASVIPGLGSSPEGAKYAYRDSGLANGTTYYYQLEDIETTGVKEMHGPVSATPAVDGVVESGDEGGEDDVGEELGELGSRITFGDPSANELKIRRKGKKWMELTLITEGFYAIPQEDGSVLLEVPGFEDFGGSDLPDVPAYRTWQDVRAGRNVQLAGVSARQVAEFASLRPSSSELVVVASGDGTVQTSRRRKRRRRPRHVYYPESWAQLMNVGFQGASKKALVEMAPLRWDATAEKLVLAKRLVVRISFKGKDKAELKLGKSHREVDSHFDRNVLARIAVTESGLYGVSFESVFGRKGKARKTKELSLSRHGEPVAFFVTPNRKKFKRKSTLYFVSEGSELNPYGSEAVYELLASRAGTPMGRVDGRPVGAPTSFYWKTVEREENLLYQAAFENEESIWQWDWLFGPMTNSYPFEVENLSSAPENSKLRVWLHGASDFPEDPDHHVRLYVNGTLITETWWDGETPHFVDAELGPGLLLEGENSLEIEEVGDTEAEYSMVMLDRFEVSYPAQLVNQLEGSFTQSGIATLPGGTGQLFDMTEAQPRRLAGVQSGAGGLSFGAVSGHRYLLANEVLTPEVRRARSTGLKAAWSRAEYLVIGPRAFLEAAEPLLAHRREEGLISGAVATEDIYDEFGFGEATPESIKEFLSFVYHHWSEPTLRYVALLGDGTYDPKDYLATGVKSQVAVKILKTQFVWTASDPWYGAINGDDILPDIAIGRLPAASFEEAEKLVQKILDYENGEGDPEAPIILVADNPDGGGNFVADAEELASTVLSGEPLNELYLSELGAAATRSEILSAFDSGASLVSYMGHGAIHLWANENLLNVWDVESLSSQSQQPFMLTMNCLNGYFHFPYFNSLSEELLKAEGKGIIAAFSPTGLSLNSPAHRFHRAILDQVVNQNHGRLGDAILEAQIIYAHTGSLPELITVYHLLGDPALRLR